MKLFHYREKCIGCNACVEHAPNDWELDPVDGKANLKNAKLHKNVYVKELFVDEEQNKNAAEACPMGIIKVTK